MSSILLGAGRSQYQGRLPGGDGCHLELELEDYRAAYSRLLRLYGIANHFDFTAFEIRHMYIAEGPLWQRNNAGNVTGFQHDKKAMRT